MESFAFSKLVSVNEHLLSGGPLYCTHIFRLSVAMTSIFFPVLDYQVSGIILGVKGSKD